MQEIISQFVLEGTPISCSRYGPGHINETWLLVTNRPHLYIVQKISPQVFPDPAGLMNNIILVTEHIRKIDPDPRHSLALVPTKDGKKYVLLPDSTLWRIYEFIPGGVCLDRVEAPEDFRQSGKAFGIFMQQLSDFPAEKLTETIPGFHDTPRRFRALHKAIEADPMGRAASVRKEIDFCLSRESSAGALQEMLQKGDLPLRVTHNDTKLNNVMLDEATHAPLCVIDLDTVMPGLAAADFGDAIRFGASTAAEDEKDLEKVHFSPELYRAYAEGFLSACGGLTPQELDTLPEGARLMTLECGVRFLTDYLEGDTYFHIARPEHNLDRTRTQLQLVREMEQHLEEMHCVIRETGK